MNKETEHKIQQLSLLEQNMQATSVQKQNFQLQLLEIESALKELGQTEVAYKIVANIMIKASKQDLSNELQEKKEIIELRISSLEKQEKQLRDKATALQKEVLGDMKQDETS
ncbi:MAG: prefoldin subunit [Candidatus Woesearchaeota archaeon]